MGHYVSAAQLLASVTEGMADRHVTRIHRGRRSFMLALNDEKQMEQGGITRDALQALNNVARETASLFTAETDLQQVEEIHTTLEKLATSRAQEVDTQRDLLRTLARQYEAQKAATARPATAPTHKQHQEKLSELDQIKFGLGKTITSLEQSLSGKEGVLAQAKEDAGRVEHLDEVEAFGQDTEVLRLKVYRDLGFLPIRDDQGRFSKLLVSSTAQKEIHSVSLADHPSAFTLANKLWQLAA